MSSTVQHTPTSHLHFGHARVDITPPVGIYHPMWGAARHDRATGIHRPLYADVLYFAPLHEAGAPWAQLQLDMVGLSAREDQARMVQAAAEGLQINPEQVILAYSHTHAGGVFSPDRVSLPGGELIEPYLNEVAAKLKHAGAEALANGAETVLTYTTGRCDMAANRDFWDEENQIFACGHNPGGPADDTLLVVRATDPAGNPRAAIVNYACHPTTLAWDNTEISPDYVGALREQVEAVTGAPCIFTLGACGELGPRRGFVGDPSVADANGREVAFAALSSLATLDPPAQDFHYAGPVISGATVGAWEHRPFTPERQCHVQVWQGGGETVDLPKKSLPDPAELEQQMAENLQAEKEADAAGDAVAARDYGARAERARRWLQRLKNLPEGKSYPFPFSVRRMGDAFWVSTAGEPYSMLQTTLREHFPDYPIIVTVMASALSVAYLLPADRYGKGLYQEEPSILGPGCLEQLTEAVANRIAELSET